MCTRIQYSTYIRTYIRTYCTYILSSFVQMFAQCTYVLLPAVSNNGAIFGSVEIIHTANKLQDGDGLFWDSKVRPGDVVQLLNLTLLFAVLLQREGCGGSGHGNVVSVLVCFNTHTIMSFTNNSKCTSTLVLQQYAGISHCTQMTTLAYSTKCTRA